MNFITLHRRGTVSCPHAEVVVNAEHVVTVQPLAQATIVRLADGSSLLVSESVDDVRSILNPMRVFAGHRDVGTAAEQDTRTKLLIDCWRALRGSPVDRDKLLVADIRKEVGEAAIEQHRGHGD